VAPLPFKWIWSSAALPKQKFFFWLLVQDRLNTKDMMERKSFYVQCNRCVLCDDRSIETMAHLFFHCDFSRNFWWKIGMEWNEDMDHINMMIDGEKRSNNIFFKEALIAGCWSIWIHRNNIIFDSHSRDILACFAHFKDSFGSIRHRIKPSLKEGMLDWLDLL
jgi:hypothetical protein